MNNNSYNYLDTDKKAVQYFTSLKDRNLSTVALDIEGEFNLHHYGEHLCLVQIYDSDRCVVIDPNTVSISLIKGFLECTDVLKIIYDCTTDRTLLYRTYGIKLNTVLDLLPAVELLGYEKKGLGEVLKTSFSHDKGSKKKYQKYNWMKRPIEKGALEYAVEDVMYLFDLKEKLFKEMISRNHLDSYILKNIEVQTREISLDPVPGILKKGRFKKLPKQNKKIFLSLLEKREKYAERLDLPPNSVVSNDDLFSLACFYMKRGDINFSKRIDNDTVNSILSDFKVSGI
jgi:ribonuclease D